MPDLHSILIPCPPFAGMSVAPPTNPDVIASDRDGLGFAMVLARKNKGAALSQRIREYFHIELPQGPHRTSAGDLALAGTGPGAWLATRDRGGNAFALSLMEAIGDLACVSDQSDGYAVLRIGGPKVRETLAKMFSIDLHPRAFKPGDVAVTVAAHIGATIWRLEDSDGAAAFEVAVFRSLAAGFWHALADSAAEFGFVMAP